jgi:hypothetical protein
MAVDLETEIRRATSEYERTLASLRVDKPGKHTTGHEASYSQAYQYLVRLGAKPQIKKKYR